MTLEQLDKNYNASLEQVTDSLSDTYDNILKSYKFDLSKTDISKAIIQRLATYYRTQNKVKKLLDKGYLAPAADFFVESTLFFLRLYCMQEKPDLIVQSEKDILISTYMDEKGKTKREVIRPDISILENGEIIAIIECKTQLGWNRINWERDFSEREKKLKKRYPKAKAFLLVMTGSNWKGLGNSNKKGTQYFCLLEDVWPTEFQNNSQILTNIEELFNQL